MPHHVAPMRSSRRVPPLADKDIDHEISLVNRDNATIPHAPRPLSVQTDHSNQSGPIANPSASDQALAHSESQAPLTQHASDTGKLSNDDVPEAGPARAKQADEEPSDDDAGSSLGGSLDIVHSHDSRRRPGRVSLGRRGSKSRRPSLREPETEIDILYENQRGGFLCGIPLFSSAALGNLDPPAWTNFAHKPSPTDIHTAQVPDPSWQWAWPAWRINHDEQIQSDGDGWEYSFMFSKKFSWHPPKWYSSFVRRRAWIRRRVKISIAYEAMDEHAMNPAYFTVIAKKREPSPFARASDVERTSTDRRSRRSQEDSRGSRERPRERPRPDADGLLVLRDIQTTDDLIAALRQSRIDREKLEAVENYIANCTDDLLHLQDDMHEIMSMFVFQTSRKTLLARLTQLHDDVTSGADKGKAATATTTMTTTTTSKTTTTTTPTTKTTITPTPSKAENLAGAIKHADEEVRRLEYWSDIKGMTEDGEAVRAVDSQKGWESNCWQGLDKSGAGGIDEDKITR
ncbi:putative meiotically up-regulated 65 protein [Rosellinia necatrix]|uniref:Putative meiotically up-regulated 65 protein n=1 Tax=Rosellinia necatrix TaxID=77044 RepID=A0A1S7UIL1_ROSNE|nr:putative meiotically up-regulated 65 protein [Rosellinia necatrix]